MTHEGRYGLELVYKGPYVVVNKNSDFDRLAKVNFDTEPTTPWFDQTASRREWRTTMHLPGEDGEVDKTKSLSTDPTLVVPPLVDSAHGHSNNV
ncbi:hypothetical protein INT45_002310 [Circinella minor]|uniref:Uncharacterized protein n=1 Tax=Circinella minor TaxID=1195481 RepID=A0A8H7RG54_9FUNG|nr:hypothetical protein INT45_002310 [Circinella minor]